MHATFRQYDGISNPSELIKQATETFLPQMKEIPGYIDYYFVDVGEAGGRMVSVSVFEDEAGTEESNRRRRVGARPSRPHSNCDLGPSRKCSHRRLIDLPQARTTGLSQM